MKTLDEVIDNFEKACDLERRCEGCSGCLGQEYGCPNDGAECVPDALYYLKVLKDILDPLKVKKNSHEITCPWCQSKIAILLPESNDPLTWDELRKMADKPVWWKHGEVGEWLTIYRVPTLGNGNDNVIYATTCSGVECWIWRKDLDKFQYYRKERE